MRQVEHQKKTGTSHFNPFLRRIFPAFPNIPSIILILVPRTVIPQNRDESHEAKWTLRTTGLATDELRPLPDNHLAAPKTNSRMIFRTILEGWRVHKEQLVPNACSTKNAKNVRSGDDNFFMPCDTRTSSCSDELQMHLEILDGNRQWEPNAIIDRQKRV